MNNNSGSLFYAQLWEVRWLFGTLLTIGTLCGLLGIVAFSYETSIDNFQMGANLSLFPAFLIGWLVQRNIAPIKLSENQSAVVILGAVAVIMSGVAISRLLIGSHAG